jgi:hypothetical protein
MKQYQKLSSQLDHGSRWPELPLHIVCITQDTRAVLRKRTAARQLSISSDIWNVGARSFNIEMIETASLSPRHSHCGHLTTLYQLQRLCSVNSKYWQTIQMVSRDKRGSGTIHSCQHTYSWLRIPRDSRPHFTASRFRKWHNSSVRVNVEAKLCSPLGKHITSLLQRSVGWCMGPLPLFLASTKHNINSVGEMSPRIRNMLRRTEQMNSKLKLRRRWVGQLELTQL